MPAIFCTNNGKWKWGTNGACIYNTKAQAEGAGIAIEINKGKRPRI